MPCFLRMASMSEKSSPGSAPLALPAEGLPGAGCCRVAGGPDAPSAGAPAAGSAARVSRRDAADPLRAAAARAR